MGKIYVDQNGKPTTLRGKALVRAKENGDVITKAAWNKRHDLVDSHTGESTQLTGGALAEAKAKGNVITKASWDKKQNLVDSHTGKPTQLTGDALAEAKAKGNVITRVAWTSRQNLVDSVTGEPTHLTGDALATAKENGDVITKAAWIKRQNLVDSVTGEPTHLTGDALATAKENGDVITKDAWIKRQNLVDSVTGEPTHLTGDALATAKENGAVITKAAWNERHLVDHITGQPTQLTGDALAEAKAKGHVITKAAWKKRRNLVDSVTGEPTHLTGDALATAKGNGDVITKAAWNERHLVDHITGQPTHLTGDALAEAKAKGNVITRVAWTRRQNLVDSVTGESTHLTGDALAEAKAKGNVITKVAWTRRQNLVDSVTGEPTHLTGDALARAKKDGSVITKDAWKKRQNLVDSVTGEPTHLTGDALARAKKDGSVITKHAWKTRQNLVDSLTGEPTHLTGDALAKAKDDGSVITKQVWKKRQNLVDSVTGEPTHLTGDALARAKEKGNVITKKAWSDRQKRKFSSQREIGNQSLNSPNPVLTMGVEELVAIFLPEDENPLPPDRDGLNFILNDSERRKRKQSNEPNSTQQAKKQKKASQKRANPSGNAKFTKSKKQKADPTEIFNSLKLELPLIEEFNGTTSYHHLSANLREQLRLLGKDFLKSVGIINIRKNKGEDLYTLTINLERYAEAVCIRLENQEQATQFIEEMGTREFFNAQEDTNLNPEENHESSSPLNPLHNELIDWPQFPESLEAPDNGSRFAHQNFSLGEFGTAPGENGIFQTSVMHHYHAHEDSFAENFLSPSNKKILILDADAALLWENTSGIDIRKKSDEDRRSNLRNPDQLKKILLAAKKQDYIILVVTFQSNPLQIASYLGTLLNDGELKGLSDNKIETQNRYIFYKNSHKLIQCIWGDGWLGEKDNEGYKPQDKNETIRLITEMMGFEDVPFNNIILVDDANNCAAFQKMGGNAIEVKPTDEYILLLQTMLDMNQPLELTPDITSQDIYTVTDGLDNELSMTETQYPLSFISQEHVLSAVEGAENNTQQLASIQSANGEPAKEGDIQYISPFMNQRKKSAPASTSHFASSPGFWSLPSSPQQIIESTQIKKILILDFDQTITIKHTFRKKDGRGVHNSEREENLRNPEELKDILVRAQEKGYTILIVTFHNNPLHVASYIGTLLKDNDLINLPDKESLKQDRYIYYKNISKTIQCILGDNKDDKPRNKNAAIKSVLEIMSISNFQWGNVILVDDDNDNCTAFSSIGGKAIHAALGSNSYLSSLNEIIDSAVVDLAINTSQLTVGTT